MNEQLLASIEAIKKDGYSLDFEDDNHFHFKLTDENGHNWGYSLHKKNGISVYIDLDYVVNIRPSKVVE